MEELVKQEENKPQRDELGRLLPGNTANPNGRPKGKSLKEYWRERFEQMTDEEREEFSRKVAPDLLWKMAEGNPTTPTEHEVKGAITINLIEYGSNDTSQLSTD